MSLRSRLETDGVCVCSAILSDSIVGRLRGVFGPSTSAGAGARDFVLSPAVREQIEAGGPLGRLAAALCGREVRPVRVLFFDKTPAANWAVPWHQDRTIAVDRRAEVAGYGPWTIKEGAVHVEPPVAVLNDMLTLRAFLDDCGAADGALEVVVGSHLFGRVLGGEIKELVNGARVFVGVGRSGDVLAMRALGIHRSKRAATPTHRRVLHVDYSSFHLPAPLQWRLG